MSRCAFTFEKFKKAAVSMETEHKLVFDFEFSPYALRYYQFQSNQSIIIGMIDSIIKVSQLLFYMKLAYDFNYCL